MADDTKTSRTRRGKPFGRGNRGKPGRRKGAKNMKSMVQGFASERHTITENGRKTKLTSANLLVKTLIAKAIEGDVGANVYLEQLRQKFAPKDVRAGVLVVPEVLSEEEWIRRIKIHNATVVQPDPPEGM